MEQLPEDLPLENLAVAPVKKVRAPGALGMPVANHHGLACFAGRAPRRSIAARTLLHLSARLLRAPQAGTKAKAAKAGASVLQPAHLNAQSQGGEKTIEDTYQKLTQLDHILLRPDTYIGSTEAQQQKLWVHDGQALVFRDVSYVPGLYKIFDEILVNAADNKVRDPKMDTLRVDIDAVRTFHILGQGRHAQTFLAPVEGTHSLSRPLSLSYASSLPVHFSTSLSLVTGAAGSVHGAACLASLCATRAQASKRSARCWQASNTITVWNNGDGVPVEVHKEEKVYVPEMIFGHLLTSSNYNDNEKKARAHLRGAPHHPACLAPLEQWVM